MATQVRVLLLLVCCLLSGIYIVLVVVFVLGSLLFCVSQGVAQQIGLYLLAVAKLIFN